MREGAKRKPQDQSPAQSTGEDLPGDSGETLILDIIESPTFKIIYFKRTVPRLVKFLRKNTHASNVRFRRRQKRTFEDL